jgi:hypothetical protein
LKIVLQWVISPSTKNVKSTCTCLMVSIRSGLTQAATVYLGPGLHGPKSMYVGPFLKVSDNANSPAHENGGPT